MNLRMTSPEGSQQGKAQLHGTPLFSGRGVQGRWLRCWGKTQEPAVRRWVWAAFLPPRGEEDFQEET